MQNKGLIWTFIVLLSLACIYQLSFTWVAAGIENDAKDFANGSIEKEEQYLDSIGGESVYPLFDYSYNEVKKNVLNLGLDLKGGMNVTLEVSVADVIRALSSYSEDEEFQKIIELAKQKQKGSQENFVQLFDESWSEIAPEKQMTSIFYTLENKDNIDRNATNEEVIEFLKGETDAAFDRTFEVLRTRVNLFGVAQPNIQKLEASDRILVELPGVKNKERVRQLLQGTAKLEFWETYDNAEIYPYLAQANDKLNLLLSDETEENEEPKSADSLLLSKEEVNSEEINELATDTNLLTNTDSTAVDSTNESSLLDQLGANDTTSSDSSLADQSFEDFAKDNPLFAVLSPSIYQNQQGSYSPGEGPVVGVVAIKDTGKVNDFLSCLLYTSPSPRD